MKSEFEQIDEKFKLITDSIALALNRIKALEEQIKIIIKKLT